MKHTATRDRVASMRLRHKSGFTLIELMVVILVSVLLLTLAVPSLDGLFREQALEAKLESMTKLVQRARWQAIEQEAPVRIIFTNKLVFILAELNAAENSRAASLQFGPSEVKLGEDESLVIEKRYQLEQTSSSDSWTFWPSGNCEPTTVSYEGPQGTWTLAFDPLSANHRIEKFDLP